MIREIVRFLLPNTLTLLESLTSYETSRILALKTDGVCDVGMQIQRVGFLLTIKHVL